MEVDVDQVAIDLGGFPDLLEQVLGHGSSYPRRSPAATTANSLASDEALFSKWCGRSASKVTLSPALSSWRRPSMKSSTVPSRTTAVSRLPGSCIGGSSDPPVATPGASVCSETSARW